MQLRILTLNIWGIHFVAKSVSERIDALIKHLNSSEGNYDIIALQEVWSKKDYCHIRGHISSIYPYSYYFLSGLIGSGCCIFSKHLIVAAYEHQFTLNGFPHKIHHGDYFAGKSIGLCKILINGLRVNVYTTHLHANYHKKIPEDIYLGHRVCQSYEMVQFIESTSNGDTVDLTVLLGDLNLQPDDLGLQLIQGVLKLNNAFDDRMNKNVFDQTIGNSGLTCFEFNTSNAVLECTERIDHILYRGRNDNVRCLEAYPTLYKIPGNDRGLCYSDHLAVYALLEVVQPSLETSIRASENVEQLDEEARSYLNSASKIITKTILNLQRERILFGIGVIFLIVFVIFANTISPANSSLYTTFIILIDVICIFTIVIGLWFIVYGKPVERNALNAVLNAIRLRLRMPSPHSPNHLHIFSY